MKRKRGNDILIMMPRSGCIASVAASATAFNLSGRDVSNVHWQSIDDNNVTVRGGR